MPRKSIKERAFQEPVHEDAPGFNPNQGHKNLIQELNQEVLPSWVTDLIGDQFAQSKDYQFRLNASGQLEYFGGGEWHAVQGAGLGGGGSEDYAPTLSATAQVNAPFSSDCFAYVDLETDKSYGGRDIRVYQYGIRRASYVYSSGPGNTSGTVKYRVVFECTLEPGVNDIEVRYGDKLATWSHAPQWALLDNYDMPHMAFEPTDGYAILVPRSTPEYLPRITNWTEAAAFGTSTIAQNTDPASAGWNFPQQFWNANREAWIQPRITGYFLDIQGNATASWDAHPKNAVNLRRSSYATTAAWIRNPYIRLLSLPQGNLYGIRTSMANYMNNDTYDSFDVIGLFNNGWWLHAIYKHLDINWSGNSRDIPTSYGQKSGIFHFRTSNLTRPTWTNVVTNHNGYPDVAFYVPLLKANLGTFDTPLLGSA